MYLNDILANDKTKWRREWTQRMKEFCPNYRDRERCRETKRTHLAEVAAAACEYHSDLVVHKAANIEPHHM